MKKQPKKQYTPFCTKAFNYQYVPGLLMYIWTGVLPFSDCKNSSWATTRLEVSSVIYKNSTGDICQFLCNKKSINNLLTWIYISGWLDPSHLHKSWYSMRHRARWEAGLRWVGRKQERETMSFPLPLPITNCILTLYYATCYRITLQHGIQNWNSETRNQNPAFEQPSQMYS